MPTLIQVFKADFIERTRTYRFLALIGVTIFMTYLFVPPVDADYVTVALGERRGVYNAPWVGTMMGLAVTTLLSLIAFYIVKNAIDRDERTGVGRLLAATPIRTWQYLLGKWLSNIAVLSIMLVVLSIMGFVMQQIRAEATDIDILALLIPLWLMGLPVMAVVGGTALFFESVPFLKGGFGNVAYFFLWIMVLSFSIVSGFDDGTLLQPSNDLFGIKVPVSNMQQLVSESYPDYNGDFSIGRSGFDSMELFVWEGVSWPVEIVFGRIGWTLFGAVLALAGTIPFNRFDSARRKPDEAASQPGRLWRFLSRVTSPFQVLWRLAARLTGRAIQPLTGIIRSHPAGGAFLAELRLNLGGQPWWWTAGLIILIIVGLTATDKEALADILPFAWIWPVLIWSQLGTRESRFFTESLVFSTPNPLWRQLPATLLAGFAVSLITAAGALVWLFVNGDFVAIMGLLVGAMFIPALAFALGVWSGTSRLFELVYLVWWYLLINSPGALDFMGISETAISKGVPLFYLGLTGVLLIAGYFGRKRQLGRL